MEEEYDLIVIGSGPAGLSAGTYIAGKITNNHLKKAITIGSEEAIVATTTYRELKLE